MERNLAYRIRCHLLRYLIPLVMIILFMAVIAITIYRLCTDLEQAVQLVA